MSSRWRKFFDGAGTDIWTVIDYALDVAAEDFPHDLRLRRDGFVEKMFAHRSVLAEACLPVVGHHAEEENEDDKIVEAPEYDVDQDHVRVTNDLSDEEDRPVISADLYDDAEALTDAMEAESRQMQEVYSIKESIADISEVGHFCVALVGWWWPSEEHLCDQFSMYTYTNRPVAGPGMTSYTVRILVPEKHVGHIL